MAQSTFSLSWEAHRNNICYGLSALQQNEEFVDMTLAADGHFVKVHQMIMALASTYFKELISSAGDRHPVIFLNKISYSTLSALLEYIYTGEVVISIDNLPDLIQTAKDLHIKGLEDMKLQDSNDSLILLQNEDQQEICQDEKNTEGYKENTVNSEMDDVCYFEITERDDDTESHKSNVTAPLVDTRFEHTKSKKSVSDTDEIEDYSKSMNRYSVASETSCGPLPVTPTSIQYTVSNQGSMQMILNRYMYYLKHSNRNRSQQWRCVDYLNKRKCPAIVMTKNNIVKQRISAHTHAYHDKRIAKKIHVGAIYTEIQEAEIEGNVIKNKVRQERIERDSANSVVSESETV